MSTKTEIRVIKKCDLNRIAEIAVVEHKPKTDASGDMVRNVMNWVNDLKDRKLEETRLATGRFHQTLSSQKEFAFAEAMNARR
jgi:hypothetical protein